MLKKYKIREDNTRAKFGESTYICMLNILIYLYIYFMR